MGGEEQADLKFSDDNGVSKYERTYEPGKGLHRYDTSIRNLIPIRKNKKDKEKTSIDNAGLLSIISFSWISKVMYKAYKKGITLEELPTLSSYDTGTYNAKRLELLWKEEVAGRETEEISFLRVAWKFCSTRIYASSLVFIGGFAFSFLSYTLFMRKLLEYLEKEEESYEEGIKWALLLIFAELLRTTFMAWSWALNYRTALRLRSACLTLLYKKIIRVDDLGNKNIGKVINMFSNDAQRIFEAIVLGPGIVGAPVATVFSVFYVLWHLGLMASLGMLAFFLFFPIQYGISRLTGYLQNETVKISDMRVRLMNEILDCIKLIKMYAWEKCFSQNLLDIRKKEREILIKNSYCLNFSYTMAPAIPIVAAVVTFVAYVAVGNNLTAAQVFSYTTLLDAGLRTSLYFFQDGIEAIVPARISFNRMKSLLLLEDGICSISKPILKSQAIAISNGTFAYNNFDDDEGADRSEEKVKKRDKAKSNFGNGLGSEKLKEYKENAGLAHVLFDVSFEAPKGKLVGICGHVGSGKSSLLLAALGQLRVSEGQVTRDGSCAYVSQQAWISNASLRENILFGEKFDHNRYYKAIYACSLSQDIGTMSGGDGTEIGERGINLSGGQKQRVALARALYADRDIYLLDDPLSAVDSRVGSHIFDNLILGALSGKTVLFVTHQIQYLNRCDDIYMMRNGKIIEHGTHDELMALDNEYALMVTAISTDKNETSADNEIKDIQKLPDDNRILKTNRSRMTSVSSHNTTIEDLEKSNVPDTQLTVADKLQTGTIKAHTYHSYIMAAGGYFLTFIVVLTYIATDASLAFSPWWLATWIKAGGGSATVVKNNVTIPSVNIHENPDFWYYRNIYAGSIGFILLASAMRSIVYSKATIRASTTLHNHLFKKIIASPMRFFDTTPSGRIQHLFSRDMDEVDNRLPLALLMCIEIVMMVFFAMLIICVVFPWFILPMCILGILYYFVGAIFRVAIRDLKRMDNQARAPIISFVNTTVQGLSTIHAFGKENDFMTKFSKFFDENSRCLFMYTAASRWLAVRIDALSVTVTGITAFLIIVTQGTVPAAMAGLALAYATQISDAFQYVIRAMFEAEVRFISVEKINHYIRTLKSEENSNQAIVKPPSDWPSVAEIKFQNVSMSYGEDSPLILNNLSFSINAGEKIGIVGRTGAGKSSLTVALFRLVELAQGKIEIDDVDISEISLERLRRKLSIIPQDPVLFSGTVRSNLDPFKLYTDAEIWKALEKTELKNRVQAIPGHLDASVGFGGDNLSLGERQLLCLSRALLRNSKILVLDEATAAVDPETEIAVQKTVQQEFSNCTILIIAHRLQTVLSLDRILVMESGRVLEFDTPSNLIANQDSEFSKMLAAAEKAENQ